MYKGIRDKKHLQAAIFLLFAIGGTWLNVQGGWVKDFSFHRIVYLPLLFHTYTISGMNWYILGLLDDLLGFGGNMIGIYGLKRILKINYLNIIDKKYFIIPVVTYIAADVLAFYSFYSYYMGSLSLSNYGTYWNGLLYFVMLPSLLVADLLLFYYDIS